MNKLGFAINFSSNGETKALECNHGEWSRNVGDIREYIKLFDGLIGSSEILTFMSFVKDGCMLSLLKNIPGRVTDFECGWVFIPNSIRISGEEVCSVINFAKGKLSDANIREHLEEINSYFAKEYPLKETLSAYRPSSQQGFAYRYVDKYYSLSELLEEGCRYQDYYGDYNKIFLLEEGSDVKIKNEYVGQFSNLTNRELVQYCIVKVPSKDEIVRNLGQGVVLVFENDTEIPSYFSCKKNDVVKVYAKKAAFEKHFLLQVKIKECDDTFSIPTGFKPKWQYRIMQKVINVLSENGYELHNAQVKVNGSHLTSQGILIDEADCNNVRIDVSSSGYDSMHQNFNLFTCSIPLTIKLPKSIAEKKYPIRLKNDSLGDMIIRTKYFSDIDDDDCPLQGYTCDDESGEIRLSQLFVWKQRILGFFGGTIVVLILVFMFNFDSVVKMFSDTKENQKEPEAQEEWNETGDETESDTDQPQAELNYDSLAIAYLDSSDERNAVWEKDSMEQYQLLKGLFDDLNQFNIDNLTDKWRIDLSESKNFAKILESYDIAKRNLRDNFKADKFYKPAQVTYNGDDDFKITVHRYRCYIETINEPAKKNTEQKNNQGKPNDVKGKGSDSGTGSSESQKQGNEDARINSQMQ